MTDRPASSDAHLSDEDLSARLDGAAAGGTAPAPAPAPAAHAETCPRCRARSEELAMARAALAGAAVPGLSAERLDALVGGALAAFDRPAAAERTAAARPPATITRGRFRTPPPSWLLAAVASIVVLTGLAAGIQVARRSPSSRASVAALRSDAASSDEAGAGGATTKAADPEVVGGDLGDLSDPEQLAARLGSEAFASAAPAAAASGRAVAGGASAGTAADDAGGPEVASVPTTAAAVADDGRAQCRVQAEAIGAGRLGPLLSTSTLRWAGAPAEVLVFALREPANGISRQALVLSRPGCALLADPRF